MVTGGQNNGGDKRNTIEYIRIPEEKRLVSLNRACPEEISLLFSQLPIECRGHKTAILNNHLWMVGGYNSMEGTYILKYNLCNIYQITSYTHCQV